MDTGFARADQRPADRECDEWWDFERIASTKLDTDVYGWWESNKDRFAAFHRLSQQLLVMPFSFFSLLRW
jgi:hypothetical protein